MPKITLDTNCIINLLDDGSTSRTSVEALDCIIGLYKLNILDIAVTTRFYADQDRDNNMTRRMNILKGIDVLGVATVGGVVRLGVSRLDSQDMLIADSDTVLLHKLEEVLYPGGIEPSAPTATNKINDVDHIFAHYLNNRDIFVTDDHGIWKKREYIKNLLGIIVMTPNELVDFIKDRININPVATLSHSNNQHISSTE